MKRLLVALGVLTAAFAFTGVARSIPEPPPPDQVPWGLDRIDQRFGLDNRFEPGGTGDGVRIYVIDTGVKMNHVDFEGRALPGATYVNDGRGAADCNGHGTHVAAIAAGRRYGVAKGATVVSVRIGDCSGGQSLGTMAQAVRWVTAENQRAGVRAVVNISWAPESDDLLTAVSEGIQAGLVYTVAAGQATPGGNGQDECNENQWSRLRDVIVVSSSTAGDQKQDEANYGGCVDLYAPGHEIVSAWPFPADWSRPCTSFTTAYEIDGETYCNGTSFAAPHVAGVAALYLQRNPFAAPADVEAALKRTATQDVIFESQFLRGDLVYARIGKLLCRPRECPPPPPL